MFIFIILGAILYSALILALAILQAIVLILKVLFVLLGLPFRRRKARR